MHRLQVNWRWGLVAAMLAILCSPPAVAGTFKAQSWGEVGLIQRRVMAAHFLSQATFGPTMSEIDALAAQIKIKGRKQAFTDWINAQFNIAHPSVDPTTGQALDHEALLRQMVLDNGYNEADFNKQAGSGGVYNASSYKHYAWWHKAMTAPDQLRQRMTWALAQILVVAEGPSIFDSTGFDSTGQPQWFGLANYYDMLCENAFGNYRDLLEDASFHPIMGVWLSHLQNKKAYPASGPPYDTEPDENYAREIMQLFSIGLVELQSNGEVKTDGNGEPIETYTNETIKALARVFTGLTYNNNGSGVNFNASVNFHQPMEMYYQQHDFAAKVLTKGYTIPARSASEANGLQDVQDSITHLFNHSNVGPFICRLLIQRFVKSNPSKQYMRRVVRMFNNNGQGVRGDMKAVLKAILLDNEALNSQVYTRSRSPLGLTVTTKGTEYSRLREPVLRYTAMLRAMEATSNLSTPGGGVPGGVSGRSYFPIPSTDADMSQAPYQSDTVFNYYLPNYQPPGDILNYTTSSSIPNGKLYAPEFQIFTAVIANRLANRYRSDVSDEDFDTSVRFAGTGSSTAVRVEISAGVTDVEDLFVAGQNQEAFESVVSYLDLLLCHGSMNNDTKQSIVNALIAESGYGQFEPPNRQMALAAILAVLNSPACAIGN